ncbi:MAG: magnesium transporter CorA family protein [Actinobacteria bacterium]|nr:magnesium transporter CorA family protein [Actinomycetota bacterium]
MIVAPHTRAYRRGVLEAEGFPIARVSDLLAEEETMVWVDLCGPTVDDLHTLAAELGLHELAVEDALGAHQRPKLDHYATHLFLACHAVSVDEEAEKLRVSEIDTFIGDRWVITVRKENGFDMQQVIDRCDRVSDLADTGVAFVVYAMLDVLLDGYFDTIESFDAYYDKVSDSIFSEHPLQQEDQRHWFKMRQALIRFHRIVFPLREAISSLIRREHDLVSPGIHPYYQDLYDHVLRITESTDSLRDLVSTIVETNLSLRDYRQNQVMKKVTSWAAIIAVPTLVTGFYGMNVRFPGIATQWGTGVAVALMVVTSFVLYVQFKSRDWL